MTLGIGVGATTAIFSVVHGVLLKPLPYTDSERIVRLYMNMPASESPSKRPLRAARGLTAHQIDEVRTKVRAFSHAGTASGTLRGLPSIEDAARLQGATVSASVLEMIQAKPARGRVFAAHDEAPAAPPVIVLSHTAWQRYFGGNASIGVGSVWCFRSVPTSPYGRSATRTRLIPSVRDAVRAVTWRPGDLISGELKSAIWRSRILRTDICDLSTLRSICGSIADREVTPGLS